MSVEQLKADLGTIEQRLGAINSVLATPGDVVIFLQNELVPFIGSMVGEVDEMNECVQDMYANAEDTLQPETAGVFAAMIATGRELVATLAKAAKADTKNGADIIAKCAQWLELSKVGEKLLSEITVDVEDDELDDDEEDEDDQDDDGDEVDAEDE